MKWIRRLFKFDKSPKAQAIDIPVETKQVEEEKLPYSPKVKNRLDELKNQISKPASQFTVGGFRPTNEVDENWIAQVTLFEENEQIPVDSKGKLMIPLGQFYLPSLPFIPDPIKDITILTVFISEDLPEYFEPMGKNWIIREYQSENTLVRKDFDSSHSHLKAFPLKPNLLKNDFPLWDTEDIPEDIVDEFLELENSEDISNYYEVTQHSYLHKFGGYPSYCQSGIDFGQGFEFVFQISSDEKVCLNVIDSGSLLFAKNVDTNEWKIYYDFY